MALPATNIRKGMVIKHEGDLWIVVQAQHVKMANRRAVIQTKLKNLRRGDHINYGFNSSVNLDVAYLDERECEYLFQDGHAFVFMDCETYEQYPLSDDLVGDAMPYIPLNSRVTVTFHEGHPLTVDLPASVVLKVVETEPGYRGNTVTNVLKPATVETGLEVRVPMHINEGDTIKVKTDTGEFQERVN